MNRHQPSTLKTIAFLFLFFTFLMTSRAASGQTPGLVSHWPGEGNANDVVGGNNGTLQGGAAFAPGIVGQAFSFDGVSRYVEVPDSPSLSITGPLTLEAWINTNTIGFQQAIIEKYDVPGHNGYFLRIGDGKLVSAVCNYPATCSENVIGATTLSVGTWHHVVSVYDGTSIKVYLDGILDGSVSTNFTLTEGGTSLKIGARGDDANTRFHGLIDEVKIHARALSAAEIQASWRGLVSRWRAEGDALDSAGINNGTLLNGTGFMAGVSGQAFSFDGSDDRVSVPNSPSLNVGTGDFTVSFFAKFNDLENNGNGLIHKDTYGNENTYRGWLFNICDNCAGSPGIGIETRNIEQGIDNNARYPTSNFQTGRWYHIAAVRQSNVLYLYINGVLRATVAESSPTDLSSTADLEFGSLSSGSRQNFAGGLDEVNLFNRALSASEILALGIASDTTPPIITPTITGTTGNAGWYVGDVGVSWSATDPESSVSSSTGCDATTVTSDTSGVTFTCSATSAGGTTSQSITVKRDATAPVISCGSADAAWHASNVSIGCTASDNTSQVANASDSAFSLTTNVAAGTETANAATNNRVVCDNSGNCSTAAPIGGIKVDRKAPIITITTPASGIYLLNQSVAAAYDCADGGSGVATCSGPVASGGNIATAATGSQTFTVTATDHVGNAAAPQSVNYSVAFAVVVLYDQTKAVKSGSTIPIKIQIADANGANMSGFATGVHAVSVVQTSSNASVVLDDAGEANPDFDFRYSGSAYIFNLKTSGYGTGSYLLNFTIGGDPTLHTVRFQVRQ